MISFIVSFFRNNSSLKRQFTEEPFKECMIKILLEPEAQKRIKKLETLQSEMERYALPIRKLPSKERKKNLSNKYCNNQKHSFFRSILIFKK